MTPPKSSPGKPTKPAHPKGTPDTGHELDPRAELGLKTPTKDSVDEEMKRQKAEGQKATQFDGSPNPQGARSSAFKPEDDTPARLKKTEGPRDDQ